MGSTHQISLKVNGEQVDTTVASRTSLADCLREHLRLTGTHLGCEHGVCGACTVLVDGLPARSCILLAAQADGADIVTVEGLDRQPEPAQLLQEAFCETHALQCGYCTPGMLLAAYSLLAGSENPTADQVDEAIGGNICRCTGYQQIREAIDLAASRHAAGDAVPA